MGKQRISLLREIERCRQDMITLASHSSLTDRDVVQASAKLDSLLNQYYSLAVGRNQ
ncbi:MULTISPECIES: aspartyl-phosphate phosphatase Spo0E family protein [unclassified Bacillus (in: firmicutes)]|uniref:aspartyl-phosphate phosphatase Spo0E family protein n=1 Tax=unclassified Bacillus (in: firmicutes) TaxID=185979 RepID=UPI000B86FD4E|nr:MULTISPECIES: aspartyl-phosphate phosphatase Spo0E family protein [unclassified Bacillus (in: firmicutes)]